MTVNDLISSFYASNLKKLAYLRSLGVNEDTCELISIDLFSIAFGYSTVSSIDNFRP
jgi:hypothetical protein